MRILIYWIISVLSLIASVAIAKGIGLRIEADFDQPLRLFLATAVLGLINATIGNILRFVTLPLNCLTFGIAWIIVNALIFWWVGTMDLGYRVDDFLSALVGSILMSLILGMIGRYFEQPQET
ncbi:MAG TPA: phage holin family protein [Fimbriimonadales bacterium]|nr:phage holin family protein [Fimbriimonadales bacterium]